MLGTARERVTSATSGTAFGYWNTKSPQMMRTNRLLDSPASLVGLGANGLIGTRHMAWQRTFLGQSTSFVAPFCDVRMRLRTSFWNPLSRNGMQRLPTACRAVA